MKKASDSSANAPFFIVGSGRSGSTLLRAILTQHSRLVIPPETWFLIDLARQFGVESQLERRQVEEAAGIITNHYRWPDLELDAQSFRSQAIALPAPTIRELADIVYKRFLNKSGRPRWGDKTPPYIRIVPELARLYPDSKFIHLIRDGHDVVLSFVKNGFYGRWLCDNVGEWKTSIQLAQRWRKQLPEERFLDIRYESLVLSTESTIAEICEFLGEEPEPAMFNWEGSVRDIVPERELHIHQNVFRKPKESDVFRWKRTLSNAEILKIESLIGPELEIAGYERRFRGLWAPVLLGVRLFWERGFPKIRKTVGPLLRIWRSARPTKSQDVKRRSEDPSAAQPR